MVKVDFPFPEPPSTSTPVSRHRTPAPWMTMAPSDMNGTDRQAMTIEFTDAGSVSISHLSTTRSKGPSGRQRSSAPRKLIDNWPSARDHAVGSQGSTGSGVPVAMTDLDASTLNRNDTWKPPSQGPGRNLASVSRAKATGSNPLSSSTVTHVGKGGKQKRPITNWLESRINRYPSWCCCSDRCRDGTRPHPSPCGQARPCFPDEAARRGF